MGQLLFLPSPLVHDVRRVLSYVPFLAPVAVYLPPGLELAGSPAIVQLGQGATAGHQMRAMRALREAGYRTVGQPMGIDSFMVERCRAGQRVCVQCNRDLSRISKDLCLRCRLSGPAPEDREYDRTDVVAGDALEGA